MNAQANINGFFTTFFSNKRSPLGGGRFPARDHQKIARCPLHESPIPGRGITSWELADIILKSRSNCFVILSYLYIFVYNCIWFNENMKITTQQLKWILVSIASDCQSYYNIYNASDLAWHTMVLENCDRGTLEWGGYPLTPLASIFFDLHSFWTWTRLLTV